MNCRTSSERLIALCTALAVLHLSAMFTYSSTLDAGKLKMAGALTVHGSTKVDGETAIHGQTVFSGSTIETADAATSIVSLGGRGRLELMKSSCLHLKFDESGLNGALETGRTRIYVSAGTRASVTTKDAAVISDASRPAAFSVEYRNGDLTVAVLFGRVEVRQGGRTEQLGAGQFAFNRGQTRPQPDAKNDFSRRKMLAVLFSIGGAIALIAVIFSNGDDDDEPLDFGGCVQILSPTGDNKCPS